MIIENMEQGSPEWHAARCGIPTASNFGRIMTPKTLKFSAQAQKYACELLAEQSSGIPVDHYQSDAMRDGSEREAEAREAYEFIVDVDVTQVGVVYANEEKMYSCSPDGLVMVDDSVVYGLEAKCPLPTTQMGYLLDGEVPNEYIPQIQGALWITSLDYWDFFSYHANYRHLLIRVYRDKKFIGALADNMDKFLNLIEITRQKVCT